MRQLTAVCTLCVAFMGLLNAQEPAPVPPDIEVKLLLLDVQGVDTVSQSFTATLAMAFRWQAPHLAHQGPDSISKPLDEVWYPNLQILNQQRVVSTLPQLVEVYPDGEVVYRQRLWGSFSQPLDLKSFPFDSQRLQITLANVGFGTRIGDLVSSPNSGIASTLTMSDWETKGWEFVATDFPIEGESSHIQGMVFSMDVKRDTKFFKYKVLLPLILIVMMSWLVFWIDPSLAASQISVSVTAMLTMIAYRFALAGMMPRLAFLTRLDYFVMLSTFVVFMGMVQVVYTAYLAANDQREKARKVDRMARWVAPLIFVILSAEILYFRLLT